MRRLKAETVGELTLLVEDLFGRTEAEGLNDDALVSLTMGAVRDLYEATGLSSTRPDEPPGPSGV